MKRIIDTSIKIGTESDAEVAEGAASDGHVNGKLRVTEGREESANTGNGIRKDDSGACNKAAGVTGGYKNSGTNHAAYTEPNKIVPTETLTHV